LEYKGKFGGPNGIRTRVLALRGLRPRPLDDGTSWLGREDSNPYKQIQSLPSCRWTTPHLVMGIGRFSHAFLSPVSILCPSKNSRLPSFLITIGKGSSTLSYEVNRCSHLRHSLLLLMTSPSLLALESITLSSMLPQKGHFMLNKWDACCRGLLPSHSYRLSQRDCLCCG
jgi:hypothetical protein